MATYKKQDGFIDINMIEHALNVGLLEVKSNRLMQVFEETAGHKIYTPTPVKDVFLERENQALAKLHAQKEQQQLQDQQTSQQPTKVVETRPMGAATKMPAFLEKGISYEELYKRATDEFDKARESSDVLKHKDYSFSLCTRYKEWVTPELFDYLSMKGPRAEAELRAACYPARVSFTHRVIKKEGRWWATPYITVYTPNALRDLNDDWSIPKGECAYSFYLTKEREVCVIEDEVVDVENIKNEKTRDKQKAKSLERWRGDYRHCEKRERVVNPKTGVEQYLLLKSIGNEEFKAKWVHKKADYYKWNETYDVTDCRSTGSVDYDEYWGRRYDPSIEAAGRSLIAKIPSIITSEENLIRREPKLLGDYDKNGKYFSYDAPKGFVVYMDKDVDSFCHKWSQDEQERYSGYEEHEYGHLK